MIVYIMVNIEIKDFKLTPWAAKSPPDRACIPGFICSIIHSGSNPSWLMADNGHNNANFNGHYKKAHNHKKCTANRQQKNTK